MEGSNYGWADGYKGKKLKHSQKVINSKKNTTKNSFSNAMKGTVDEDCCGADFGGMTPAKVNSITMYGHTSKTITGKRRNKRMSKKDEVKEEVVSTIKAAISKGVVKESTIRNLFEEADEILSDYVSEEELRDEFEGWVQDTAHDFFGNSDFIEEITDDMTEMFEKGISKGLNTPVSKVLNFLNIEKEELENDPALNAVMYIWSSTVPKDWDEELSQKYEDEGKDFDEFDAVESAFPKLSSKAQKIIAKWYSNEGAIEDFDDVESFADYIDDDIGSMLDAASEDDQKLIAQAFMDAGDDRFDYILDEDEDLEESYKGRRRPMKEDAEVDPAAEAIYNTADRFVIQARKVYDKIEMGLAELYPDGCLPEKQQAWFESIYDVLYDCMHAAESLRDGKITSGEMLEEMQRFMDMTEDEDGSNEYMTLWPIRKMFVNKCELVDE